MSTGRYTLGLLGLVLLTAGSQALTAQWGPPQRGRSGMVSMAGTYELESTRGDNAQRAADQATRNLPPQQRDRVYQSLLSRLQSPATLAIQRNGRTVTISSSNGPRATFDADGRTLSEPGPGGRTTLTRAMFTGNRLSISTSGNRNTDYLVTFEPLNNGTGLLVTRRLDSDDLRQPVTIQSYYRRVADEPRWNVSEPEPGYGGGREAPSFFMPDGTRIVAVMNTSLGTRSSRTGQRFSMTVLRPVEFRDAQIYGVVARVNPYGQGRRADMRVEFDAIESIDGDTFDFNAVLESVRTRGGMDLRIDTSEDMPDRNRTDTTVKSGAIGAALGAIIGGITGGGKGAALGAAIGGAGGVILAQDNEQSFDLPPGSQVTLRVVSSRYRDR